jgi:hypothetical protein
MYFTLEKQPKPPLGLIPKRFHDDRRRAEIILAVYRYIEADEAIPIEWIEEYNKLLEKVGD